MESKKKQMTQSQRGNTNIRVYSVPRSLNDELRNISKRAGISFSSFLKLKLTEVRDSFPVEKRTPPTTF